MNNHDRINFFGLNLDIITMEETLKRISKFIEEKKQVQHVDVNVAKLVYAQKDEQLRNIINSSPSVSVDGAGVVLGARTLGINIPERVAGIDLMEKLIEYSAQNGYKVYFFGAEENIVKKVVDSYNKKYSKLKIAGYRNGYYTEAEEEQVIQEIKQAQADILFVAMGVPKQEIFLYKNSEELGVTFSMGVGGSFDVIAGKVKRAPICLQKLNLEWVFRLIQEPRRMWKRYATTNTFFAGMLFKQLIIQKIFCLINQKEVKENG